MDSLEMSGASLTKVKNAVIDSGTSLLAGPKADVQALMTKIGAKPLMKGEYTIDCNKALPDIDIVMNGHKFTLSKSDYVISSGGTCLVGIIGIDIPNKPLWILGDVFMRKY